MLTSGGIDSTACIHMLQGRGLTVSGLFVDFGQAARLREIQAVRKIWQTFRIRGEVLRVDHPRAFDAGEIVGRNAFLVLSALVFARPPTGLIALGIHSGTPYLDCSPGFLRSISALVEEHTNSRNKVVAPFLSWSKAQIVEYCREEEIPLEMTYSCERGAAKACGRCLSCRDRAALRC